MSPKSESSESSEVSPPSTQAKPRTNKRATHTRSKLGCKVCRIRRIRCDLTRPACLRCTTTGRTCEGYPITTVEVTGLAERKLPDGGLAPLLPSSRTTPGVLPGVHPAGRRSLSFFHERTVGELNGYFEDGFWRTVVMQMVHREEPVRAMVVALGSLHESFNVASPHLIADGGGGLSRVRALELRADREYTRAVSLLNSHLARSGWAGLEVTLTTALLCIYFEYLRGRYTGGYAHMRSSLVILSQWHEGSVPSMSRGTSPWSPSGHLIRAQLWPLFTTLAIQGNSFTNLGPVPRFPLSRETPQTVARWTGRGPPPLMLKRGEKPVFHSVLEASMCMDRMLADFPPGGFEEEEYEEEYEGCDSDSGYSGGTQEDKEPRAPKWSMGKRLNQWLTALNNFTATYQPTELERRQIRLMRLWYDSGTMFIPYAETQPGNEMSYDQFTDAIAYQVDSAVELLALANRDGTPQPPSISTNIYISITPMLYGLAIKCRHPAIRRRAMAGLRATPAGAEHIFNPTMACMIAGQIVRLEEEAAREMTGRGVKTEKDVPPAARVCDMPLKVDLVGNRILFKIRRFGSGELSPEMSVSWSFNHDKPVGEWPRGAPPSSSKYRKVSSPLSNAA
ncbi:hypothetical protein MAPG_06207 [Magnaporthiopsis poae ATCC 64411]|uniref:Zn(2)-C6 fungal-type domain-containing protein n=1 Tax=Magnaporthiopsis poae (strain ATCC 64411 / 73-15) TaxID=644358 RepID=A0A0C4E1E7_MAGP6|nr:hypothetical protein MAPG_06207 [Magnaporthiopsis poae ATCC 64411]